MAERFQVSAAHDIDDRVWDYDDVPVGQRVNNRRCLEVWCAWLVFNPYALKAFAQIDVADGRIHRVIDGEDTWEYEPDLVPAYLRLRQQVLTRLRFDRRLREGLTVCSPLFRGALSNRPPQPSNLLT